MTEMRAHPVRIPGSERFNSRPLPRADLEGRIDPGLTLHTVSSEQVDAVDPLTYEIVRHRVWAITEEMGETLRRMSGSHVVTEANDFNFTICDEIGEQVQVGLFNTGLVGSMDLAIFWTLANRSRNPGIEPGDMFLCNDPWVGGGLHQSDAAVLAPIFHQGRLFGWSTSICHQVDLGGPAPGGYSPTAPDVFAEAVPTPPIKIVRGGVLQDDVADAWVRRSRLPMLVGLDLRAKIAANRAAHDQMLALIDRHGADTVKAVMRRMMNESEAQLRTRLEGLPDGVWSATGYQDQAHQGDRSLHKIELTMTKTGGRLRFDFRGTDPQVGMINCPYPGLRAGVMFTILPILAGESPWSPGGILRCLEIVTDEGTINNATFPAAVGKGPVGPAWATGNLVAECLARMLDATVESRRDVQSVCAGTYDACRVAGVDIRSGEPRPFVAGMFDAMAAGFGAQRDHDGVDTGGVLIIPQGRAPDAEITEYLYPVLMLWRRQEVDSGGPGRRRGGLSGSICLVPHGNAGDLRVTVSGGGKAVSQNNGLAGGYPGCSQVDLAIRGTRLDTRFADGVMPRDLETLGADRDVIPCQGMVELGPSDALYMHWQSGGGYGDPLLREPELVADDVVQLRVSPAAAHDLYGVVLDGETGAADAEGTRLRRERLRAERLERSVGPSAARRAVTDATAVVATPVDDNVAEVAAEDGTAFVCTRCGHRHGVGADSIAAGLRRYDGPVREAGPHIWPDPSTYIEEDVVFRQLCCPACGTAVSTGVVPANQPVTR